MRFAAAHKAATYLMVAFAYLAMIVGRRRVDRRSRSAGSSGSSASWWWEPPLIRYETWRWVWTTASLLALAYACSPAIVTGDFLGVGAEFLMWLRRREGVQPARRARLAAAVPARVPDARRRLGARTPTSRTALCFLGFVIASTWALTLFHLRREMEDNLLVKHAADRASERVEVRRILDSKRIVGARFFVGTGALSFGVFLGSAVVFLALPRVGIGFFLKAPRRPRRSPGSPTA